MIRLSTYIARVSTIQAFEPSGPIRTFQGLFTSKPFGASALPDCPRKLPVIRKSLSITNEKEGKVSIYTTRMRRKPCRALLMSTYFAAIMSVRHRLNIDQNHSAATYSVPSVHVPSCSLMLVRVVLGDAQTGSGNAEHLLDPTRLIFLTRVTKGSERRERTPMMIPYGIRASNGTPMVATCNSTDRGSTKRKCLEQRAQLAANSTTITNSGASLKWQRADEGRLSG